MRFFNAIWQYLQPTLPATPPPQPPLKADHFPLTPQIHTHRIQVGEQEILLKTVQVNGLHLPLVNPNDKAPKL